MWKRLIQFIRECRTELRDKTTWPTKDAVLNTTVVVIISIVFISLALYVVDFSINEVITYITVDKIDAVRKVVRTETFLVFIALMILVPILYNRIKKRLSR